MMKVSAMPNDHSRHPRQSGIADTFTGRATVPGPPGQAAGARSGRDRGAVARAIAAGVAKVPGVARLDPGGGVEVATQYAGGKVPGVAVRPDRVVVRVVLDRLPVAPVAGHVHVVVQTVLAAVGWRCPVELVVADVDLDRLPEAADGPR
jgi:hypothetical protein